MLLYATGSFIAGTTVLVLLAVVAAAGYAVLRSLGFNSEHPWVQAIRTRPWRDGQDVLRLGLRRLPEVLIITPNGTRVAPNAVELRMNPDDLSSLAESLDLEFINSSATELYQDLLSRRGIRTAAQGPVHVSVLSDPRIPPGRYELSKAARPKDLKDPALAPWDTGVQPWDPGARQWDSGQQWDSAQQGDPGQQWDSGQQWDLVAQPWNPDGNPGENPDNRSGGLSAWYDDGYAGSVGAAPPTSATGMATVIEPASPPPLRLITGGEVAQTRVSGARAGRSRKLELTLPADPTVSRVHAEFTFREGQWWITNLGQNGLTLNGEPVEAAHPVRSGDAIRWGRRPDALISRVEIEPAGHAAGHGRQGTLTTRIS
jgi:hypothetical protein